MSSENPSTADLDQLSQKVTAIERDSMAIGTAMTRGRQFRLGIFVLLFAVVGVFIFKYIVFFKQFTTEAKQEEFLIAAQVTFLNISEKELAKAGDEKTIDTIVMNKLMSTAFDDKYTVTGKDGTLEFDVKTALQDTLTQMAESSGQMVQEIFRAQVEADMGKYTAALHAQKEILAKNLEQRLNDLVDEHYAELLDQHESILKEKFKDRSQFSEEQLGRMIYNMDEALKDLLKRYYVKELETQLNLLYDQYESFPVAEAAKPGDQPLEKQLLQKMAEMVSLKLSHTPEAVTIPPPAPKPEEEAKPEEDAGAAESDEAADKTDP
jgi:hypothetical protein